MRTITAGDAKENLQQLLDDAVVSHEPIQITSESSDAVLISIDDWRSIQDTLYLLSIPGMRESIRDGINTPVDESKELTW